ncbi:WW domain-containing oxidoreductase isoform X2 [Dermacentor andersoni]|uniref:WW domain-containing oxidoreductase isoform X2 n=1 Tax=Dermacentor andersoni TaxID=34620 RepID=UPI002415D263|nr:WW domain-containing oxidoreductase-like isoform X2 [Dermacentor andersoni]
MQAKGQQTTLCFPVTLGCTCALGSRAMVSNKRRRESLQRAWLLIDCLHNHIRCDSSSGAVAVLHGRNLEGQTAVVTGGSSGIGLETALTLASHGCDVVIACRSADAVAKAIAQAKAKKPSTKLSFLPLDLASLQSVRDFATALAQQRQHLDMLILNAGVFAIPHSITEDGFERTFQVNHLGHFYLTMLLEPLLVASVPARVVVLSSESHRFSFLSAANLSEDRLSNPTGRGFYSMLVYNDTKLCNMLFAAELDRRWGSRGVRAYAVHPGNMMFTGLPRESWLYWTLFLLARPFTKSMAQGAATTVLCATAPELADAGGAYFNNCCQCRPSAAAEDEVLAGLLWKTSQAMISRALLQVGGGNAERCLT